VCGRPVRSPRALISLARALERDPQSRPVLPAMMLRWPPLMRVIEPWRPSMDHRLARGLHLAAMVGESLPQPRPTQAGSIAALAGHMMLEVLAFPFRLLLGRFYA
jgi:hypothetical protein